MLKVYLRIYMNISCICKNNRANNIWSAFFGINNEAKSLTMISYPGIEALF